ncbi:MAG: transporter substrate-binding domain-containing protein, partial [Clostridia bacterium]|nr:transporter substrate-binding domain-containing protein [Clostridia bacterium]
DDSDDGIGLTLDDIDGKRIGVLTGTISGRLVETRLPNAQVNYFNTQTDSLAALKTGKIDAWCTDEPIIRFMKIECPELLILDEYLAESNLAAIFPKTEAGQALCSQYNDFLDALWADGTMAEIDNVWFGAEDAKRTAMDYESLPATNGTLHMAADLTQPPFTYMKDNRAVGYDIDVAARFCQEYGYGLVIEPMSFDGVLAAVQSGKCDFASSCITITEERAESVLFSVPNYYGGIAMAVLKAQGSANVAYTTQPEYTEFSDLSGKTVSMLTGAPFEELVKSKAPDVGEFTSFNSTPDILLALKSGKTDAFLINNAIATLAVNRDPELALFPQNLQDGAFGLAFEKGDPRRDAWQAAFDAIPREAIEAAWEKWTGADESVKVLPEQDWPGANGTVRVAACDTLEPMSYMGGDGALKGFDLEVILMIAREMDVRVEFTGMEFAAILSSVQSGKADIGAGSIIITEERAQAVDFVEYYPAAFVLIVRAQQAEAEEATAAGEVEDMSTQSGIAASFNKTFIREGRWKLFLDGVLTTLLITVLTILFGTLLGFMVFMLCRNGNPVANLVTRFCLWLVQGMPGVVLLMILYYVIFGSVAISGIAVAVIGFTLTFGAAVFGLLKMGVGAVDGGQYEAAYALGYSNRRTFFKIILPQ